MHSRAISILSKSQLAALILFAFHAPIQAQRYTARAQVGPKTEIGWPIVQDAKTIVMIRRDGSIKYIPTSKVNSIAKISNQFAPYTFNKFAKRLAEIHGPTYQVTPTRHFVIVHPHGQGKQWVQLFEKTYAQFSAYFRNLGIKVKTPEFPLTAIVFAKRSEFDSYVSKRGVRPKRSIVGYYMLGNNRILTFDQSLSSGKNSASNRRSIIHEVVHQLAFNTGVHSRFAPPPQWVGEGVAVMLESPGIRERNRYRKFEDRIAKNYFANAKKLVSEKKFGDVMKKMIISDSVFRSDQSNAYTVAWALTYYLANARPSAYSKYNKKLAERAQFTKYTDRERWQDFTDHFGADLQRIESAMSQFFERRR